jgi:hypothetical protein
LAAALALSEGVPAVGDFPTTDGLLPIPNFSPADGPSPTDDLSPADGLSPADVLSLTDGFSAAEGLSAADDFPPADGFSAADRFSPSDGRSLGRAPPSLRDAASSLWDAPPSVRDFAPEAGPDCTGIATVPDTDAEGSPLGPGRSGLDTAPEAGTGLLAGFCGPLPGSAPLDPGRWDLPGSDRFGGASPGCMAR